MISNLPFGIFAPDASDRDSPALQEALNVLPVYGSYRLTNNIRTVAKSPDSPDDNFIITGGHSHLYSQTSAFQYARPDGDTQIVSGLVVYPPNESVERTDKEENDLPLFYKFIDEKSPDDRDGVKVTYVTGGAIDNESIFTLSDVTDPGTNDGHILRVRYSIDEMGASSNADLFITLRQDTTDIEVVQVFFNETDNTNGFVLFEHTFSSANIANITDYSDLNIVIDGVLSGPSSDQLTDVFPDEDIKIGGWTDEAGTTVDLFEHVADFGNDAEYVEFVSAGGTEKSATITFSLPDLMAPNVEASVVDAALLQFVRRVKSSVTAGNVTITLREGTKVIHTNSFTPSTSFVTVITSAIDDLSVIKDWSNLTLDVTVTPGQAGQVFQVSGLQVEVISDAGIHISWVELEIPRSTSPRRGDINVHYIGTQEHLYSIDRIFNWENVTRFTAVAGDDDYGQGSEPQSWSFASWGNDVIATNYENAIQIRTLADVIAGDPFSDLIDPSALEADEYEPRARFSVVVNNFLVLADINPNGAGAGGSGTIGTDIGTPYTVWWSAINQNGVFKVIDLTTQSDFQLLIDTLGQITGSVGGEFGVIFKRNSIYRMDYVGSDLIFTFDVISVGEGTAFPRSIVKVESDIYFWGNGGIRVLRNGQYIEPIGDGQFTRYLFDSQYNPDALAMEDGPDTQLVDSQVVGTYDPLTRCIFWLYRPARSTEFGGEETKIVVYNTVENRAAILDIDLTGGLEAPSVNTHLCHVMSMTNILSAQTDITRLLMLFGFDPDGTDGENHSLYQFVGGGTQAGVLSSGILSSAAIVGRDNIINNLQINRVRPLTTVFTPYGTAITETFAIPIDITVTSSESPDMRDATNSTTNWADRDDDGWLPLPTMQEGEFFTFQTIINASPGNLREITMLQVDWQPTGKY